MDKKFKSPRPQAPLQYHAALHSKQKGMPGDKSGHGMGGCLRKSAQILKTQTPCNSQRTKGR